MGVGLHAKLRIYGCVYVLLCRADMLHLIHECRWLIVQVHASIHVHLSPSSTPTSKPRT